METRLVHRSKETCIKSFKQTSWVAVSLDWHIAGEEGNYRVILHLIT